MLNVPIALNCTCPLGEICASATDGLITIDCRTRFDIEFIELHPKVAIAKAANKPAERVVEILEPCITILLLVKPTARRDFACQIQVNILQGYCRLGSSRCSAEATIVTNKIPPITASEISVRIG